MRRWRPITASTASGTCGWRQPARIRSAYSSRCSSSAPSRRLMEVDIPTGRTHQIRVHASFAGHPLLGDDKYGDRERNAELKRHGLKRTFLHAQSVAFEWPGSGVPFHVECAAARRTGRGARCHHAAEAQDPARQSGPGAQARGGRYAARVPTRAARSPRRAAPLLKRINGNPIERAWDRCCRWIRTSAIPRPSLLNPPAQSSGLSRAT